MKRFVLFVLLLLAPCAPRAAAAHDDHDKGGGAPWENPAVTRSVQGDALALAGALGGGMAVFGIAAARRRRCVDRAAKAAR